MKSRFLLQIAAACGLIIAIVFWRMLPNPYWISPVGALALFCGAMFTDRRIAFAVPILTMLISDVLKEPHPLMPVVYACFALNVWLGRMFCANSNVPLIAGATILGSLQFFVITNFACWIIGIAGHNYEANMSGMLQCYAAAIPFGVRSLVGDLIFSTMFFGGYAVVSQVVRSTGLSKASGEPSPVVVQE